MIRLNKELIKAIKEGRGEAVHHIKHLRDNPLLALVDSNLITLCNARHNEERPEKFRKQHKSNKFINNEHWE